MKDTRYIDRYIICGHIDKTDALGTFILLTRRSLQSHKDPSKTIDASEAIRVYLPKDIAMSKTNTYQTITDDRFKDTPIKDLKHEVVVKFNDHWRTMTTEFTLDDYNNDRIGDILEMKGYTCASKHGYLTDTEYMSYLANLKREIKEDMVNDINTFTDNFLTIYESGTNASLRDCYMKFLNRLMDEHGIDYVMDKIMRIDTAVTNVCTSKDYGHPWKLADAMKITNDAFWDFCGKHVKTQGI